ncbi:esterase B1-like isoform X2 [Sitodiplosis mosellana]|nr:esterase B1-like isoform X2 [Sitodiplosis mosellana]
MNETILHKKSYFAFRGIPFAKPPIGELRFKAPEPAKQWRPQTIDVFKYGKACSQLPYSDLHVDSSEDCLFVNVFVPVVAPSRKLPVMIYIFGGAFNGYSGDDLFLGPDFLIEHDIILVTFNHRVGMFGFLSLGTPEYSGNMGMKDQQLAIKWVYDNIEQFGGDKTKITLSGHSSGAHSATHHMLNEESTQYFQQVLVMSGTANAYKMYVHGDHLCLMKIFAKKYEKWIGDSLDEVIELLKNVPEQEILDFAAEVQNQPLDKLEFEIISTPNAIWFPTVEAENAIRPFLQENPEEKLENAASLNITAYYTFTSREMATGVPSNFADPEVMDAFLKDFRMQIPIHGYDSTIAKKPYLDGLMKEFYDFFYANATTNFERADQRLIVDSDFVFSYWTEKWVRKQLSVSDKNIFWHEYSVKSTLNDPTPILLPGAGHADELCYFYRCRHQYNHYKKMLETKDTDEMSALNYRVISDLTTLLTNFVKHGQPAVDGNPVEHFKPIEPNNFHLLNITNDGLFMTKATNDRKIEFYDYFRAEVKRLVEGHGDIPKRTVIQRVCDNFISKEEFCRLNGDCEK